VTMGTESAMPVGTIDIDGMLIEIDRRRARTERPFVVAIDGRSGSGKSTVASMAAEATGAAVIPCDDFFAASVPGSGWDARTPAERASDALDWRRLRSEALEPLRAGRRARWRPFDFAAGPRPDGSYGLQDSATERLPKPVIVVDGAYSTRPELVDLVDFAVLVEAPVALRLRRLTAREDPGFLEQWRGRWEPAEEHYFTRVRPPSAFDLVLQNAAAHSG
jgi:uridine kinase